MLEKKHYILLYARTDRQTDVCPLKCRSHLSERASVFQLVKTEQMFLHVRKSDDDDLGSRGSKKKKKERKNSSDPRSIPLLFWTIDA